MYRKKFVRQAKLPRGAYTKDLREILGRYTEEGRKMIAAQEERRIIVEEYKDHGYIFKMPKPIYAIMLDLYDKMRRLGQEPTFLSIYDQLFDNHRRMVDVATVKRHAKTSIFVKGMSFKNIVNE
jgi:hypothetical protein